MKKYIPVAFPRGSGAKEEKALLLFYYQRLLIPMEVRMIDAKA